MARASFDSLLPEGRPDAKNQFLYSIVNDEFQIGVLWFGVRRESGRDEAYVWDLLIYPPYRGKGFGKLAMLELEKIVRELGLASISLNVFGHNERARHMYVSLGYKTVAIRMRKFI